MNGLPESQTLDVAQNANPIIGTEKRNEIPYGYCQCGCGQLAAVATYTAKKRGYFYGKPTRFKRGHPTNGFKTGEELCPNGYIYVHRNGGKQRKGRYIVEKAMGKPLPKKAVIHHVDQIRTNDKNNNLVVCENQKYHFLLHKRIRSFIACGNYFWLQCNICHNYDKPENLTVIDNRAYHKSCAAQYQRDRKDRISREELERVVGFS